MYWHISYIPFQNLSQVVTKCLTEASNKGYTSIVFPALGTGTLKYPRDETARTMLQTISSFKWANPSTSLRDVRIAVYQKDTQTLRVRKECLTTVIAVVFYSNAREST